MSDQTRSEATLLETMAEAFWSAFSLDWSDFPETQDDDHDKMWPLSREETLQGLQAALAHAPLSEREAELKAELEAENDFHNEDVESLHRHIQELKAERDQFAADDERLREVLDRIARWKMPETAKSWASGRPMSYAACYGSNGQRDLVRKWAADALNATPPQALAARDGEVLALADIYRWRPIAEFDLPDHESCYLWQEGWMLCPVVVGWRINGAWLCEAFDINSENQRPTHWRPIDTPETANRRPSKQAAQDAEDRILEKAAKIAAKHGHVDWDPDLNDQYPAGYENACEDIAQAIRDAMKGGE